MCITLLIRYRYGIDYVVTKRQKRRRGPPLIGSERREVRSVRIEPSLEAHAIKQWGSLSTAVNELLRAHRERRGV